MINKELVTDLDKDVLKTAIHIFLKNASQEVPALNKAFLHQNYKEVKRLAHKLRGGAIAIGLEDFSKQAQLIEKEATEGNKKSLKNNIDNFLLNFMQVKKEIYENW